MAFSSTHISLRSTINNDLYQAIFEDTDHDPTTQLLYNVLYGTTNLKLAADEIIDSTSERESSDEYFSSLSNQIIFLASEYPFFQLNLAGLIQTLLINPKFAADARSALVSEMATTIGDVSQSNFGHLFDQKQRTESLVQDHINLHRFTARLLSINAEIHGPDDALFILSVGLEDHPESHGSSEIDVPAAAQYFIHAGDTIFDACNKRLGHNQTSPLWTTRGKKWTGDIGYSRERWDLWKSILSAEESSNTSEMTKGIAHIALKAMRLVDGT